MLPTELELMSYIRRIRLANFTRIARHFNISQHIIPDLLQPILKKGKIRIKKIGSNKFVEVRS
jgi:predicted transcriptional regulator